MLNDFQIIRFDTNNKDAITIVPLGDVHYGAKEFNEELWNKAVKRVKDDPNCYAVLVGDMIDNGLKNSVTNVYEQTAMPGEQKKWLANALAPIKDKIIAAVGGNHERRNKKEVDDDPLYDVLCRLGIETVYRHRIAFLYVRFIPEGTARTKENRCRIAYALAITHGAGGGMYVGSGANRNAMFGAYIDGLDCLITGHTHKPMTFPVSKLVFNGHDNKITQNQFTVVTASSFLNYGGYPVERLLTPTARTITEIRLICDHAGEHRIIVTQ